VYTRVWKDACGDDETSVRRCMGMQVCAHVVGVLLFTRHRSLLLEYLNEINRPKRECGVP
jgi:hypothetical protein